MKGSFTFTSLLFKFINIVYYVFSNDASMNTSNLNHYQTNHDLVNVKLSTFKIRQSAPSIGSWVGFKVMNSVIHLYQSRWGSDWGAAPAPVGTLNVAVINYPVVLWLRKPGVVMWAGDVPIFPNRLLLILKWKCPNTSVALWFCNLDIFWLVQFISS